MSHKVKQIFGDADSMFEYREFRAMLVNWNAVLRATNMHIERLLALTRQSSGGRRQKPLPEIVAATGLLAQWKRDHTKAGGVFAGSMTRQECLDAGVPLACSKDSGDAKRGHASPFIRFLNRQRKARKAQRGRVTHEEARQERDDIKAVWDAVDVSARQALEDTAVCGSGACGSADNASQWFGDALFGLASRNFPLSPAHFEAVVKCAIPGKPDIGDSRAYCGFLRTGWAEHVFVEDVHAMPIARMFKQEMTCPLAHPGSVAPETGMCTRTFGLQA